MLFNSIDFAVFLPVVFILYWFVFRNNLRLQNLLIVVASYLFYGWWDWRFLSLILFSSLIDYFVGLGLLNNPDNQSRRKFLLAISIVVNLGLLGFFKYYNFFIENFVTAFSFFGSEIQANSLNIILPVGISFYTFQTLSYSIDVYARKLEPAKDIVAFLAFVSFFPQLVAGPIERATNLLPQFYKGRIFEYSKAVNGMRQILWGLFKKLVIADNCAEHANIIFSNAAEYSGSTLLLGALFFTFQIYGDFSGYSDIAIGTARLFGFELMQNFNFPYFSKNFTEFWRKWHISLSTWFRDYLYIPLGGSHGTTWFKIRNIFIVFIVSGFWHGANWTFIVWGALNAIYFLPSFLGRKKSTNLITPTINFLPSFKEGISIILTFSLTVFAWIFFRSENITQAFNFIEEIFSPTLFSSPKFMGMDRAITTCVMVIIFIIIEWFGRGREFALGNLELNFNQPLRWLIYSVLIAGIGLFMQTKETAFIYFQF